MFKATLKNPSKKLSLMPTYETFLHRSLTSLWHLKKKESFPCGMGESVQTLAFSFVLQIKWLFLKFGNVQTFSRWIL